MRSIKSIAALASVLCFTSMGRAQATNSGDIRGSVVDSSGALMPGVAVTVLNVNTGVSTTYMTDSAGLFDTSSIVNGTYRLTFTKDGFKEFVRGPLTVQVGYTTVNAKLLVGSTTEQVLVTTDVPLLNTESGEQSTTLDSKSMALLPNVGQDWQNFTVLLPGSSGNSSTGTGTNPGQGASINGNLPYASVLADGASTTLPSSMNADVSIFETVSEVQISTSAFSAQYGVGGIIYNQISKGGTNKFHGAAYEYFQNDALNAKGYGFGNQITVPFLRYDNYGGSISGPILRDKLFFYFNYDKTVNNGSSNSYTTLPSTAMMAGDFTGQPTIYDPFTQVITQTSNGPVVSRRSFADEYGQGNKIPANLIDPVAKAIQAVYPMPGKPLATGNFVAGTLINGVVSNNYRYHFRNPVPFTKYFGRLDYNISANNRITMSDTQRDSAATTPYLYECPIACQTFDIESNNAQISDVWTIGANTINEVRLGFTTQLNFFRPGSLGRGYPAKLGLQFAKADLFPSIQINGQNCCDGPFPATNASYKEMVYDPSDVVTMIRGKHVLHFGGELLVYQDNSTSWGSINAGSFQYTGAYTQSTVGDSKSGIAYADFLLGQTAAWNAGISPEYGARLKTPQMFIQDDIKLTPNFTINVGLRYQIQHGWSEVKNNISTFDPTITNPSDGSKGALWYATTGANGRKSLQANVYNNVLPRGGFSWLVHPGMTLRGGVGLYSYNYDTDQTGFGLGSAFAAQGNVSDQTNGITPVVLLSSKETQLPFGTPNNSPTAFAGQGIGYTAYHTPLGKSLQWNLAAQRELGPNMSAELAYVASHGSDLYYPVDINQVPAAKLGPNDNPSGRPYPTWTGISGSFDNGISNYHSLQVSLSKRLTSGLSFNVNHTWSHFLNTQDSGQRGTAEYPYQSSYNRDANYGPSGFDVRNAFKGRVVYQLPFGIGKKYMNNNHLLDAVAGGWQMSGTIVLVGGNPFTPRIQGPNNSYSQAGYWYPDVIGNPRLAHRSATQWFNPAAYTSPANGTFGNMRRNSVTGPGSELVNLSAGKSFAIFESVALQIRADAANAFNHTNYALPNPNITCSDPGVPCTATANITGLNGTGRTMQLGARLSF